MVQDAKRFISYICPHCRQSVIVERSVFSIAASPVHIKCPCGKSELSVEFMPQRVRLSVPCVYCGREHLVSCPSHAFLREKALAFSCAASGLDCCYVGEEGPVYAATARLEQAVDKLDQAPDPEEERPPLPEEPPLPAEPSRPPEPKAEEERPPLPEEPSAQEENIPPWEGGSKDRLEELIGPGSQLEHFKIK